MELWLGLFLVLIGTGAGFIQRVSGFGLGIFAMLFLPHFMPSHTAAAAISSLFACLTATYNAIRYRKNVAYKTALPMICAALISIPIAVHFSAVVSGNIFKLLLGGVLIVLSLYFMFINKSVKIKPTFLNGVLSGALGGTLGGLFSTGGPPAVLYLSSATTDNMTYFATIQFYFCFTNLYATSIRIVNGIIDLEILILAAIGMVGCMIGDFVGKKVFDKLDSKKLRYVIYVGMLISGVVMFF
ncbi:MAG: sulfite exporter TauE/SafE family protein [Oscillospiraceae bacterium]|nr:sulfite exporter TauE/SafE family protein [Oscillospiraceae bacterium]